VQRESPPAFARPAPYVSEAKRAPARRDGKSNLLRTACWQGAAVGLATSSRRDRRKNRTPSMRRPPSQSIPPSKPIPQPIQSAWGHGRPSLGMPKTAICKRLGRFATIPPLLHFVHTAFPFLTLGTNCASPLPHTALSSQPHHNT
jgi:hypothetical protein